MKTRFTPVSAEEEARLRSEHLAVGAKEYFAEHPEVLRAIVLSLIKLGSKIEAAETANNGNDTKTAPERNLRCVHLASDGNKRR